MLGFDDPLTEERHWFEVLSGCRGKIPVQVVDRIAELGGEGRLARLLHSSRPELRERATAALWVLWYRAAGDDAERELDEAVAQMERRQLADAVQQLSKLIDERPEFAEAWNKRATAYFLMGRYAEAASDCRRTLLLNRIHFGAWHGLGLCLLKLEDYSAARNAFREALAIHPFEEGSRRALAICESQTEGP